MLPFEDGAALARAEEIRSRDRGLLVAAQGGDRDKLFDLVMLYYPFFRSLCLRFGVNRQDEGDLFQEVMLQLLLYLDTLAIRRSFAGILYSIFRTAIRKLPRPGPRIEDLPPMPGPDDGGVEEFLRHLIDCEKSLKPRDFRVYEDIIYEEREVRAVASETGITPNNLYQILYRVREDLRECLGKKGIAV